MIETQRIVRISKVNNNEFALFATYNTKGSVQKGLA